MRQRCRREFVAAQHACDFCDPGRTLYGVDGAGGAALVAVLGDHQVLVGAGARLLPGVRIGDGATVGAGAVVLNDVEPGGRVGGVPARYLNGRT